MATNVDDLAKRLESIENRLAAIEEKRVETKTAEQSSPSSGKEPSGAPAIAFIGLIIGVLIFLSSLSGVINFFFDISGDGYDRYSDPSSLIFLIIGFVLAGFSYRTIARHRKHELKIIPSAVTVETKPGESASFNVKPAQEEKAKQNLEFKVASSWFPIVGIVAIILGVGFFLKYAFDNGLIGPVGQVSIGIIFGLILIGAGEFLRGKYPKYSFIVSGGGVVVLYMTLWASYAIFHLTDQTMTLMAMAVVSVVSTLLAIRYEAVPIAILGVVGGYFAPLMLSKGFDNQFLLMSYIIILNLGVLIVAIFQNWLKLNILSFIGTYTVFFAWYTAYYSENQLWSTLLFLTILFLIFGLVMFVYNIVNNKKTADTDVLMMSANAVVYFGVGYNLLKPQYGDYLGFFAFALALFYFVLGYIAYTKFKEDSVLTLSFLGISILFLTVAVPLQVKKNVITLIWSVEALVLLGLGFWLESYRLRVASLAIYILVAIRLVAFDTTLPASEFILLANRRFLTFTMAAISMGIASYLYSKFKEKITKDEVHLLAVFLITLNVVLVWAFSFESISYFDKRIEILRGNGLQGQFEDRQVLGAKSQVKYIGSSNDEVPIECAKRSAKGINLASDGNCGKAYWVNRFNFKNVNIPQGAVITKAYILFTAVEATNEPAIVKISLDPAGYAKGNLNAVIWQVKEPWRPLGSVQTPDFGSLLQELVDSSTWQPGSTVSVSFDGTDSVANRLVYPYRQDLNRSAKLFVIYESADVVPTVTSRASPYDNSLNDSYNYPPVSNPVQNLQIRNLKSMRDVSLSIIWGIYSVMLIAAGIVTKYKPIRLAALVFFAVTIFKVFLYDSRYLQTQYRIVAFIGLGIILLAVSLVYQRYKNKMMEFLQ